MHSPECCEIVANWVDDKDLSRPGWLRTHCIKCQRFIGYRPPDASAQQTRMDGEPQRGTAAARSKRGAA